MSAEENKGGVGPDTSPKEESRGVKRTADKTEINVHTPNEWERATLEGGDDRKQKFLRLMGASKKEHSGKVTIGNQEDTKQHGRSEEEEKKLKSNLEKSFEANLEYKLTGGARRHKGLGFQEEDKNKDVSEKESSNCAKQEADSTAKEGAEEGDESKNKDNEEPNGKDKNIDDTPSEEKKPESAKKYSMSFVKASS